MYFDKNTMRNYYFVTCFVLRQIIIYAQIKQFRIVHYADFINITEYS